jgi:hypothetical protein
VAFYTSLSFGYSLTHEIYPETTPFLSSTIKRTIGAAIQEPKRSVFHSGVHMKNPATTKGLSKFPVKLVDSVNLFSHLADIGQVLARL